MVLDFFILFYFVFVFSFPGLSSSIGSPGPERSTPYKPVPMVKTFSRHSELGVGTNENFRTGCLLEVFSQRC